MTRDEAKELAKAYTGDSHHAGVFVNVLEQLGVLKLEQPKSVQEQAYALLTDYSVNINMPASGLYSAQAYGRLTSLSAAKIVDHLNACGFKLIKREEE